MELAEIPSPIPLAQEGLISRNFQEIFKGLSLRIFHMDSLLPRSGGPKCSRVIWVLGYGQCPGASWASCLVRNLNLTDLNQSHSPLFMPGRVLPCPPEAIIPLGKLSPILAVRIKKRRQKVLAPVEPHGEIEACQLHRGEDKHATKFTNHLFLQGTNNLSFVYRFCV